MRRLTPSLRTPSLRHRRALSLHALPAVLLLLAALPLWTGCGSSDYRPSAEGQEGVINVVIDSVRWNGEVGEALRGTIGQYLQTLPAPERAFDLRPVNLTSQDVFDQLRRQKNVVFVAPLSDSTAEANFLRARLSEELRQEVVQRGQSVYVKRPDLWRREQLIAYLTAATPESLAAEIRASGEDLLRSFNVITRERVTDEMFEKGRQRNVERQLMEEHGFAVNVQHDYVVVVDTMNTIYLRRVLPDTWRNLLIFYVEDANPGLLSPDWVYATRDSLTREYMQGNQAGYIQIDYRRPLTAENINFLDRYGFEIRGLWSMVQPNDEGDFDQLGMGGPFVTYAFYDQESGRIYVIDGSVFAPGYNKREFLRQMEVIAHTFRTRADAEDEEDVEAAAE